MSKSLSQPKKRAPRSQGPLKVTGSSAAAYTNPGSGQLCSAKSVGPANRRNADPGKSYLTMVGMNRDGSWNFLYPESGGLDNTGNPYVYDDAYAEELLELWKRTVLDGAIPVNSYVLRDTIRIVRYELNAQDVTMDLFEGKDQRTEHLRLLAVSKLSDDEARMLGLEHLKTKQKLLSNPDFHPDDKKNLAVLIDSAMSLSLDSSLRDLTA